MKIDIDKIDPKFQRTVRSIESKPHVKFIRYMLSKRYSPIILRRELQKLGLSAPHEPNITAYYLSVIDPIVKAYGVSPLYADYKNKLLKNTNKTSDYAKDILNYRIHLCDDLDMQVKFQKFIKFIEADDIWIAEIYRFHGTASRMPVDEETGKRILECTSVCKNAEKILVHPKRYIIDKFILENLPDARITKYCRENFKMSINEYDLSVYRRCFFNIKTNSIEDKIKSLEVEKNSLETLLKDIEDSEDYAGMQLGEKASLRSQTNQRLKELDNNIKTLNMMYSEFANKVANSDNQDYETMFAEVCVRSYQRFLDLDKYKDRDVVDPLVKTAKLMGYAHDKVEMIKSIGSQTLTDKNSQMALIELYKKREEEIEEEEKNRVNSNLEKEGGYIDFENIDPDNIGGIEELGVQLNI